MEMRCEDFWNMTPKEFHYKQKGYFRKIETQERNEWERVRWQTAVFVGTKPQELAVFPWEKIEKKKSPQMSPEQIARVSAAMDADAAKNHKTK